MTAREALALNLTNHRTRDAILTALKVNGPLRIDAIAKQLGVSKMAARHQLSELAAAGLITVSEDRIGVGRPAHLYQLSAAGDSLFPRAYAEFAVDMLDRVAAENGIDYVDTLLAAHWADFAREHGDALAALPWPERVRQLAAVQSERGFMASVADDDGTVTLTQHNCIIRDVAVQYPQICRHELSAFCALLGGQVERTACIADGSRCCSYAVRPA